jgi:hypothetical protein
MAQMARMAAVDGRPWPDLAAVEMAVSSQLKNEVYAILPARYNNIVYCC